MHMMNVKSTSTSYMSQTNFVISEVTADGHAEMLLQRMYAVIHYLRYRTVGPTVQLADMPPPPSARPIVLGTCTYTRVVLEYKI